MNRHPIVLAGPTGAGKSDLAIRLAAALGGEIVNYDSVQVYRGFDIGSAKPSPQERQRAPHHLFDIVDADVEFNAADYATLARRTCAAIDDRGNRAILVGGTFFYLRALLRGLPAIPGRDEVLRERLRRVALRPRGPQRLHRWLSRVDPVGGARIAMADRHRVERALEVWMSSGRPISTWDPTADREMPSIKIGLMLSRERLQTVLDERVEEMFRAGLIEETRALSERFPDGGRPFGAIGYREALAVLKGEMDER
jgi:tRNA dimethylallyltransferase